MNPAARCTSQAGGKTKLNTVGEVHFTDKRDLNDDIIGGMSFMRDNDIGVRPAKSMIVIHGSQMITYNHDHIINIRNNTDDPIVVGKHSHVCQIRLVTKVSTEPSEQNGVDLIVQNSNSMHNLSSQATNNKTTLFTNTINAFFGSATTPPQ